MNCSICGKPVVLSPSAAQRAAQDSSRTAQEYTRLFPTHTECFLRKRKQETTELMRRVVAAQNKRRVVL
jgi:hypothetical protein